VKGRYGGTEMPDTVAAAAPRLLGRAVVDLVAALLAERAGTVVWMGSAALTSLGPTTLGLLVGIPGSTSPSTSIRTFRNSTNPWRNASTVSLKPSVLTLSRPRVSSSDAFPVEGYDINAILDWVVDSPAVTQRFQEQVCRIDGNRSSIFIEPNGKAI
jgi:hypothetical protein